MKPQAKKSKHTHAKATQYRFWNHKHTHLIRQPTHYAFDDEENALFHDPSFTVAMLAELRRRLFSLTT